MEALRLDDPLPAPAEQRDSLVLWVGDHQPSHAELAKAEKPAPAAWLGVKITPQDPEVGLGWLLIQREAGRLFETGSLADSPLSISLSMAGWERYHVLQRGRVESGARLWR